MKPLLLALLVAAAPARAASLDAAATPLAGPQWMKAFDALALPGDAAQRGLLSVALLSDGKIPSDLAWPARAQDIIDAASVKFVQSLAPQQTASLSDGALALTHARLRRAQAELSQYVSAKAARESASAAEPVAEAARERQLVDNEGRLTRTAEALGQSFLLEESRTRATQPPTEAARLRLVKPGERQTAPKRSPPPAREYAKPSRFGRALRLAAFSASIVGLFQGRAPTVFADLDETVAPSQEKASPRMIRTIASILRAGGSYGILTGASIESARKNLVEPLRRELGEDADALSRLAIATRSGSQTYTYDRLKRDFTRARVVALDGVLARAGVADGPEKIRRVLRETAAKFDFEGQMRKTLGKGVQGSFIVEDVVREGGILTQIVLVPTGADISAEDKRRFDAENGRELRRAYAEFINHRLRMLGIPLEARLAGKTSIDIGPVKSVGFQALAEELGAAPRRVLWAGDSHDPWGNDAPAAQMAGLVLNVGPRAAFDVPAYQERDGGPPATLAYYRVVALYARLSAWWRALRGGR